jgi:hypothetical protein
MIRATLEAKQRQRFAILEAREKAREEAAAVADGVVETVDLAQARGAEFDVRDAKPGAPAPPNRRLTGLEHLSRRGKITAEQRAAGERYGELYRIVKVEGEIGAMDFNGSAAGAGTALLKVRRDADERADARHELAIARSKFWNQATIMRALDLVCGEEKTPREAAMNGQDAIRIEACAIAGLDMLAWRAKIGA